MDFAQGAAYHSQSQGIAERVQNTLVQMARAADEGGEYWHDHLPFLLFSYHATSHRITGVSPAMVMYGRTLRAPAQHDDLAGSSEGPLDDTPLAVREYAIRQTKLLRGAWASAGELTRAAQEIHAADAYTTTNTKTTFSVGDTVCYRLYDKQRKLVSSWFGPCRILEVQARGNYILGDLPNKMKASKFHISQLRAYHATLPADVLAQDEYIVDAIRDRRVRNGSTQYLVKWRGYSIAKSTWEPRSELMRRCAENILAYDASISPPKPLPMAASPQPRQARTAPKPDPPPPLDLGPAPSYIGDALPHAARLHKGKWLYARRDATLRGLTVKWIGSQAFSIEVLATPHFATLRQDALDAAPTPVAAVMRYEAETISVESRSTPTETLDIPDAAYDSDESDDSYAPTAAVRKHVALPRLTPPYNPTTDKRFSCAPYGTLPPGATLTRSSSSTTTKPNTVRAGKTTSPQTKRSPGIANKPNPKRKTSTKAPPDTSPPEMYLATKPTTTPEETRSIAPPPLPRPRAADPSTPRKRPPQPTILEETVPPVAEETLPQASTTYRYRPEPLTPHDTTRGRGKGNKGGGRGGNGPSMGRATGTPQMQPTPHLPRDL